MDKLIHARHKPYDTSDENCCDGDDAGSNLQHIGDASTRKGPTPSDQWRKKDYRLRKNLHCSDREEHPDVQVSERH